MGKLIAAERHKEIIRLLNSNGSVKISQLAKQFQVSRETIRRDLLHLNEIGAVKKSHGGATSVYELKPLPWESRVREKVPLKEKLCERAMEFIEDGNVIFLDSGSTIFCLAGMLSKKSGYTIVTTSLEAAYALVHSNNKVILTGGMLNPNSMAAEGFQATSLINSLKVDIAFLGTNGFEQHKGPAVSDFQDAQTKQAIIPNARTNVVIADSSKAQASSLIQYTSWHDIDHLITDKDIPGDVLSNIQEMTDVVLV